MLELVKIFVIHPHLFEAPADRPEDLNASELSFDNSMLRGECSHRCVRAARTFGQPTAKAYSNRQSLLGFQFATRCRRRRIPAMAH